MTCKDCNYHRTDGTCANKQSEYYGLKTDDNDSCGMTAKEYLNKIPELDYLIKQKRKELDTLHEIATAIGSLDYSRDRVQTSPAGEASFAQTAELAAELDADIARLEAKRLTIIDSIQTTGDIRYIQILYHRYVDGLSFPDIAKAMHYAVSTVYLLHAQSLEKIIINLTNDML